MYKVSGPDEFAGQVFYDVHMHTSSGPFHVVSYPTKLKAEVVADFLNLVDKSDEGAIGYLKFHIWGEV